MNKIFGNSKKYYTTLYDDIADELKKQGYIFLFPNKKTDGLHRETLILPVHKWFDDLSGKFGNIKASFYIADIKISSVDVRNSEIAISPILHEDEKTGEQGYFEGQRNEYENIKRIIKSTGVFFDMEIPDREDAPFEVMKTIGASDEDVLYLKAWLIVEGPAENAAKKLDIAKGTLDRKIGEIREKYKKLGVKIPWGKKGRWDFAAEYNYYFMEWRQDLDKEIEIEKRKRLS